MPRARMPWLLPYPCFRLKRGTQEMPFGKLCLEIADYFQRSINLSYNIVELSAEETDNFYRPNDVVKEGVDIACMLYSTNGGFYYNYYTFSSPIFTSDTVIMSGVPDKQIETSFKGLFIFSDAVTACLITVIVLVSTMGSFIKSQQLLKTNEGKRLARGKPQTTTFQQEMTHHLWSLSLNLFRVYIRKIPNKFSYRILMYAWLLLALVINIQQGSNFTTNLSLPVYFCIRQFSDIRHYPNIVVKVTKNTFESKFLSNEAEKDPVAHTIQQKVVENDHTYTFGDLLFEEDFRIDISKQKIAILSNTALLKLLASQCMDTPTDLRYYISPSLKQIIQSFIINKNLTDQTTEIINRNMAYMHQSKSFERMFQICELYLWVHMWQIPPSDNNHVVSIEDSYFTLLIYVTGNVLALFSLIYELSSPPKLRPKIIKAFVKYPRKEIKCPIPMVVTNMKTLSVAKSFHPIPQKGINFLGQIVTFYRVSPVELSTESHIIHP